LYLFANQNFQIHGKKKVGSVVNCGHALVGQIKVCRFVVQNEGGDGRFVVFPKNAWPAATFKVTLHSYIHSY
jgi:hypothetical protein